ncbi:uncharacterized protein B0T15DRAFT_46879 [Chaetomium strumarium]|uniref:Uncharacterized protein n=1 Tax=Chaetomium strumarium TaxID=1170767 RepID=A0AAJ0H2N8_9PEZI|nr:hypothetical protein B0T15DRAFT_46879 [Chaetomium strumarium]
MKNRKQKVRAPGVTTADPTRPSLAGLPYEIQLLIFEAALGIQVFFVEIANNTLTISRSAGKALGLACRLSRAIYTSERILCQFGDKVHWVDPEGDIFYLYKDDERPRIPWSRESDVMPELVDNNIDRAVIRNVAVDLQYLGVHPRFLPLIRIWSLFSSLTTIHIFVPKGPVRTKALAATPDTLLLSDMPKNQIVAAPDADLEHWLAVKYQVIRACNRMLDTEAGWHTRSKPDVVGHLTSLWQPLPDNLGEGGSSAVGGDDDVERMNVHTEDARG